MHCCDDRGKNYTDNTLRFSPGHRCGQKWGLGPDEVVEQVFLRSGRRVQTLVVSIAFSAIASEVERARALEGSATRIPFELYEKERQGREVSVSINVGDKLFVCGLNFGQQYGTLRRRYILASPSRNLSLSLVT